MTRFLRRLLLAALLLAPLPQPAGAAVPPWPNTSYAYYASGEPLQEVLAIFARTFGVRLQASPQVEGEVEGRMFAETPSAFLDNLANAYGITWYYYGGVLYVNAASETRSRTIEVTSQDIGAVRGALEGLGVLDPRFGWGEFRERGVVMVSGPPPYVDLVERTVRSLPVGRSGGMTISVFRLRHASVDDRSFTYRDREVTIPGVATILRNIVTNQSGATSGLRTETIETATIATVRGARSGLEAGGLPPIVIAPQGGVSGGMPGAADPAAPPSYGGRVDAPTESPVIQADTRLNAVIVKDLEERMASYAQLIDLLDVPTALIEIEAAVIDVNTSRLQDLGIRWQGRTGNFSGGFGEIGSPLPSDGELVLGVGNASLQTILNGTGSFFLSKIAALETLGDATVQSRPSVLTLDNLQAVLDLSETFYIRVEGERVADVLPVTAGVLLKVTPRLIEQGGTRRIALDVDIEDGAIQGERQFSDIPTVRRSTISTQAQVGERDSLLIGGYYFQTDVDNTSKVPVLGDIPVLGLLFKQTEKQSQRRERLFMITPRVISLPGGAGIPQ